MPAPTAITTVKPSGNSSLLYGTGSGIHAWHSKYFLRNTMLKKGSPIHMLFSVYNVPMTEMIGREEFVLVHFPVKAPDNAVLRKDVNAIEQLEHWKKIQINYAQHNVSATITYNEDEVEDVKAWIMENRLIVTGLSFIKNDNSVYPQMPLEEITEEEYNKRINEWPVIDWANLKLFESTDLTEGSGELSCIAGACEVDFSKGG